MEMESEKVLMMHLNGTVKLQKMVTLVHKSILVGFIKMDNILRKMLSRQ